MSDPFGDGRDPLVKSMERTARNKSFDAGWEEGAIAMREAAAKVAEKYAEQYTWDKSVAQIIWTRIRSLPLPLPPREK